MVAPQALIARTFEPLAWLVATSLSSSACLEPRTGLQGDSDVGADAGTEADSAPADALADAMPTPDVPGEDVGPIDTCDPVVDLERRGVLRFEASEMAAPAVPLDGARLLGTRRVELGGAVADRVVSVDLPSGQESVILESTGRLSVIDARGGAALVVRLDYEGGALLTSLSQVWLDDGRALTLLQASSDTEIALAPDLLGWDTPPRLVEGDVAVWGERSVGATGATSARVRRARGGVAETLWEQRSAIRPPHLLGDRVLWATQGQRAELWLAQEARPAQPIARGAIGGYTLTEDAAWWIADGAVMRRDLTTDDERRAHAGPCALLASDERTAVAVCGPEIAVGGWFMAAAGTPFAFRGGEATALATRGGELIAALRVQGRRVAWLEYPSDAGCRPDDGDGGALVVARLDAPAEAISLLPVGTGCWCCDAYWPPPVVALSERALAWNYPRVDGADPTADRGAATGWALWSDACH